MLKCARICRSVLKGCEYMKRLLSFVIVIVLVISLSSAVFAVEILNDQAVREIKLTGNGAEFDCGGVVVSGSCITISAPGIYSFSGSLDDGQIIIAISKEERAEIILNGVQITNYSSPAVLVNSADKVTFNIADGTNNVITSGIAADMDAFDGSQKKAAIYADDDIKFKGNGSLMVNGYINNGIASKNDIDIKECVLSIVAANNGIKGNDSVEISGASVNITAGNHGIKTDTQKEGKGYVTIVNSSLTVLSEKAIEAVGMVTIVPNAQ